MVARVIPVNVNGTSLQIEATAVAGSEPTSTGPVDRARASVEGAFDRAQEAIVAVATSTIATMAEVGRRTTHPNEVQVKFGLKFTVKGDVLIAGASGETALEVTLTFRNSESEGT